MSVIFGIALRELEKMFWCCKRFSWHFCRCNMFFFPSALLLTARFALANCTCNKHIVEFQFNKEYSWSWPCEHYKVMWIWHFMIFGNKSIYVKREFYDTIRSTARWLSIKLWSRLKIFMDTIWPTGKKICLHLWWGIVIEYTWLMNTF